MYWLFQSCPVFFFIPPASITFSDFHKFSLLFDARHFYTVLQVTLQKKWYQEYRKACKHCTCNNHIPLSIIATYHVSKINHNCSIFRFLIYNQRPQVIVPVPQEKSNTQWDNNWSWKRKYDCKKHSVCRTSVEFCSLFKIRRETHIKLSEQKYTISIKQCR